MTHGNSNHREEDEIEVKIVLLGNSGVGKTSVVTRFVYGTYNRENISTIGASFAAKRITVEDKHIKLQIWDTAGQERFKSMTPMYYRDASIAVLVYDITNIESFEAVKKWVEELGNNISTENVAFFIVGNKCDLAENRQVSTDIAKTYAQNIDAEFFETSAKDNEGINTLFDHIGVKVLHDFYDELASQKGEPISLLPPQEKKKRSCCS